MDDLYTLDVMIKYMIIVCLIMHEPLQNKCYKITIMPVLLFIRITIFIHG